MFGYIQDAKTVGTIFITGIAYTLCTAVSAIKISVKNNGIPLKPIYDLDEHYSGRIEIPGLRYGQSGDILFNMKGMVM